MKNKIITTLSLIAAVALVAVILRVIPWAKCSVASYDLNRKTEFSWVTGNCMVERSTGERIYLNQMRGYEE